MENDYYLTIKTFVVYIIEFLKALYIPGTSVSYWSFFVDVVLFSSFFLILRLLLHLDGFKLSGVSPNDYKKR